MNPYFDIKINDLPSKLNAGEIAFFKKNGWVGTFPLLSKTGVEDASAISDRSAGKFKVPGNNPFSFLIKPWFKSMHAKIPEYREIAGHPFIVEKIASLLGDDVIVWGTTTTRRVTGQKHRWHVDVEHNHWKGVSVFLGLKGTTKLSSLSVIAGSQNLKVMPQTLNINDNDEVLAYCRQTNKDCELVTVDINEGEFFLFDGPIWHSSDNKSEGERTAMIIQYSTPDYKIKIPKSWNEPIQWHPSRPPCVLVKGVDRFGLNKLK
jgi:hypothetical protein